MKDSGFSLTEVLVSLFVIAILAVSGAAMLSNSVRGQDRFVEAHYHLQSFQQAHALLRDDLGQVVQRPSGNSLNRSPVIVFEGRQANNIEPLLRFVRGGWVNPNDTDARSTLQTVQYVLQDDKLFRRTQAYVDAASSTSVADMLLLEDIERMDLDYRVQDQWLKGWVGEIANEEIAAPSTVRVTIDFSDGEQMIWLFSTSGSK